MDKEDNDIDPDIFYTNFISIVFKQMYDDFTTFFNKKFFLFKNINK